MANFNAWSPMAARRKSPYSIVPPGEDLNPEPSTDMATNLDASQGPPAPGSQAADEFVNAALGVKGANRKVIGENKNDSKNQTFRKTFLSDEESRKIDDQIMGITRGQQVNDKGEPQFVQVPSTDPKTGLPLMGAGNQMVLENGAPIPDPSKDTVNPENPYQQQKAGIERLRQMIGTQAENTPVRRSLSSLAGLADYLAPGGHAQEAYQAFDKAHPSYSELAPKLIQYQDDIQKRQQDMTKSVIAARNSLVSGNQLSALMAMNMGKQEQGQSNIAPKNPVMAQEHWLKAIQSDKELQKVGEGAQFAATAAGMLNSHTSVSDSSFMISLAKALVGSRLAATEIGLISKGDKAVNQRWDQMIANVNSGKLDPHNRAQYAQLLGTISQALREHRDAILQNHKDIGHTVYGPAGVDPDLVDSTIESFRNRTGELTASTKSAEQKAAAKAHPKAAAPAPKNVLSKPSRKSLESMSQTELDAYEKSLGAH